MGFLDFLRGSDDKSDAVDPTRLELSRMKVGYFVNYDMKTWAVKGYSETDWGDGFISQEWELNNGDEQVFLEREKDDEVYWSLYRLYKDRDADALYKMIKKTDDLPDEIQVAGKTYYLEDSGAGYFCENGVRPGVECLMWSYEDESGDELFSVYQWDEDDFSAYIGMSVEEYQFTDITPGE
jgi:hypothetical protein